MTSSDVGHDVKCKRTILTFFRVLPLRLIAKSEEKGRLVKSIDTVLSTLTANFQSESHADVASPDLCRWTSHSEGDGLMIVRAESYANWSLLVETATQFGKSVVLARKRRGPSTEPWGTPAGTASEDESQPFSLTHWWRSERVFVIQAWASPRAPKR